MTTPRGLLSAAPDEILVARAVDGDTDAFAELLRRYTPLVRAYATRITGGVGEADDAVQEAFVIAWQQLPTLRDPSSVKAWLMRIVSRRAFAVLKERARTVPLDDDRAFAATTRDPEAAVIRTAQLEALSHALDRLPDDQRRCWLLREVAELSYQEIAADMNLTPGQVRGSLARARASLVVQMEGWR